MAKKIEISMLNPAQQRAVEHREGPLLVVAGPGTGKTGVITQRIRHLLESDPELAGENILGLTYTRKAAGEMLWRVRKAVGEERARGVTLKTFHSFCYEDILKEQDASQEAIDETDHWILLRRNIAELKLHHYKKLSDVGEFLHDFVSFFSRCQDQLVTPEIYQAHVECLRLAFEHEKAAMDEEERAGAEEEIEKQEELARVYRISEELQRRGHVVTHGRQIMQAVHLLQSDAGLRRSMQERFRYILVDEFQDTNMAQIELLWLLAGEKGNIFVVGDHNQAIYRFRGASFGSFRIFAERFCGLPLEGTAIEQRMVKLGVNYRSTPNILRASGQVIKHNEGQKDTPWSYRLAPEKKEGARIRIAEFDSKEQEAYWIAEQIHIQHAKGEPWKNFAVLYRNHSHREELLAALRERGIPHVIRKLPIDRYTLYKDLTAYLRLLVNTSKNVACARLLAIPEWGFGPSDLVRLAERAKSSPLYRQLEAGQLAASQSEMPFSGSRPRAVEFLSFMAAMREKSRKKSASDALDALVDELGLAPLPSEIDALVLKRLQEFVRSWEKKNEHFGGRSLREFIEYLDYFEEAGGKIDLEEEPEADAVQLMTAHGAKGLEFRHVFVMRMAKGDFPTKNRSPLIEFPADLMKDEPPPRDFHLQEERRLFYVAMTRAQQQLTLTAVLTQRKHASQFLEDLLSDAKIGKQDVLRLSPKVVIPASTSAAAPLSLNPAQPQLFGAAAACTRMYSQIALWTRAYRPPASEPLELSATSVETYLKCPLQFMLGNMWRIRGGAAAKMTFGSVMHQTIAELSRSVQEKRTMSLEETLRMYERKWPENQASAGFTDDYEEQEYRAAGREQLTAFHGSYTAAPPNVERIEAGFTLPLPENVVVSGRIDQVNRLEGGGVEIVDYKTGRPRDGKSAKESLQLSLYALAARDVFEMDPRRLVFYNLTSNEAVASTRDAKTLKDAEQKVLEVAALIRAQKFPAKPGWLCKYCDFRPICPEFEQLVTIRPAAPTAAN